mmetsp:Transcript_2971/g.6501  ORF Transcript_2971/g.6501 Transcript_2971/m.6501 type:complete len:489 (-) Transcript_2971:380-1846(-)
MVVELLLEPREKFLLASSHLDFYEGFAQADGHGLCIFLEGLCEIHDHLLEVVHCNFAPQRCTRFRKIPTEELIDEGIQEMQEIGIQVGDLSLVAWFRDLQAGMGKPEGVDASKAGRQALHPRFRILWNLLGAHVVIFVVLHLSLALSLREPIFVVGPVSDQNFEMSIGRATPGQVGTNCLGEGSDVVQVLHLHLFNSVLHIVDQLGREQRGQAKNGGALSLGHRVIPSTLGVHQQHTDLSPGLISEDEGCAPQPNPLGALVLARAPSKSAGIGVLQRALEDLCCVTLQEPTRGFLLEGILVAKVPALVSGLVLDLVCLLHLSQGLSGRAGLGLLALLLELVNLTLERFLVLACFLHHGTTLPHVAHHQIEEEAFAGAVGSHHCHNRDIACSRVAQAFADDGQVFLDDFHLRRLFLQLADLQGNEVVTHLEVLFEHQRVLHVTGGLVAGIGVRSLRSVAVAVAVASKEARRQEAGKQLAVLLLMLLLLL